MQLLLKNGRLVDPPTGRDEETDINIVDGKLESIGTGLSSHGAQVIDLKGKIVAPGLMDMHVHLREPGFEYKETIASGVSAAAAGGFTAVCCMPNTNPSIDDASVIRYIQEKARAALGGLVDVYVIGAATKERKGEHLSPLAELAEAGAVAFSDDGAPVYDAEVMRRALEYAAMFHKPIIQHAQDLSLSQGAAMNEGFVSTVLGLPGMPGCAEDVMVARDILLSQYAGGEYHVAHISTANATAMVREAKARGLHVTAEVTPHHIALTDEAVRGFDTNTKMNPPLRAAEDVEALKRALKDGTIDVIASDHAPHSFDEKQVEFQQAPFGIIGLETSVGVVFTELVDRGILTIPEMIKKMSTNPRKILHLPEIRVAEGEEANLTILDPTHEWVVDPGVFKSKSKNTPFGGRRLSGKALAVINHGQVLWA
jgi:dihydroorotase